MAQMKLVEAIRHLRVRAQQRRTGDRGKRAAFSWTDTDAEAATVVLDAMEARLTFRERRAL